MVASRQDAYRPGARALAARDSVQSRHLDAKRRGEVTARAPVVQSCTFTRRPARSDLRRWAVCCGNSAAWNSYEERTLRSAHTLCFKRTAPVSRATRVPGARLAAEMRRGASGTPAPQVARL